METAMAISRPPAAAAPLLHLRPSLLFLERGPRKRARLIAQSAEKLLDDPA